MTTRAVLDANVWISGLVFPGGAPSVVVDYAIRGPIERNLQALISQPLIDQIDRSLRKFDLPDSFVPESLSIIRRVCEEVDTSDHLNVIQAKPSDNRVLECAIAGMADVIVTGDKRHLLPLEIYRGIPIVSPRVFLDRFESTFMA
jgi:uncharacterized protein